MERVPAGSSKERGKDTYKKVERLVQDLRAEGYVFDFEETNEHFVVRVPGTDAHVPKWETIPLDTDGDGKKDRDEDVTDYLRRRIIDLVEKSRAEAGK